MISELVWGRSSVGTSQVTRRKSSKHLRASDALHFENLIVHSALDDVKAVLAGNPLPHLIHAELSAAQLGAGRLIVVGDVHGCPDELKTLLRKCQYQQGSDVLVFNGDIINKGPKSVQVSECATSH